MGDRPVVPPHDAQRKLSRNIPRFYVCVTMQFVKCKN